MPKLVRSWDHPSDPCHLCTLLSLEGQAHTCFPLAPETSDPPVPESENSPSTVTTAMSQSPAAGHPVPTPLTEERGRLPQEEPRSREI